MEIHISQSAQVTLNDMREREVERYRSAPLAHGAGWLDAYDSLAEKLCVGLLMLGRMLLALLGIALILLEGVSNAVCHVTGWTARLGIRAMKTIGSGSGVAGRMALALAAGNRDG